MFLPWSTSGGERDSGLNVQRRRFTGGLAGFTSARGHSLELRVVQNQLFYTVYLLFIAVYNQEVNLAHSSIIAGSGNLGYATHWLPAEKWFQYHSGPVLKLFCRRRPHEQRWGNLGAYRLWGKTQISPIKEQNISKVLPWNIITSILLPFQSMCILDWIHSASELNLLLRVSTPWFSFTYCINGCLASVRVFLKKLPSHQEPLGYFEILQWHSPPGPTKGTCVKWERTLVWTPQILNHQYFVLYFYFLHSKVLTSFGVTEGNLGLSWIEMSAVEFSSQSNLNKPPPREQNHTLAVYVCRYQQESRNLPGPSLTYPNCIVQKHRVMTDFLWRVDTTYKHKWAPCNEKKLEASVPFT